MAPRFDLVAPGLAAVERYRPDLLVVELLRGQRPFSGLLEQVDWRLCGLVSRWVERGRVTGALGELLLVHPGRHLRCAYLLVVGIGAMEEVSSLSCNRLLDDIVGVCDGLRLGSVALPLPGCSTGRVRPAVAAQLLAIRVDRRPLRVIAVARDHLHVEIAATLAQ